MGIIDNTQNIKTGKFYGPSYNAVQLNLQKPTLNTVSPPVIYDYPQFDGQMYYPPMPVNPLNFGQKSEITRTPSGIEGYDNYSETDINGEEVVSVKYSKEGDKIVQNLKTKSPDGTTIEKILKNSSNFKSSNIVIKDINGNTLLSKEKIYSKQNEDSAQTIVNGSVYNVSGLKGNVITVEHNGESVCIDLDKMLDSEVKLLKMRTSPNNLPIRDTKITDEEKQKLYNRIKSLGGDELFRLSKSVEHLQFLDEKSIESFFVENGKTLLLSSKDYLNSNMVTKHELGHAVNHSAYGREDRSLSDYESFKMIRNYEKMNFKQNTNMTDGDKLFGSKFMFSNPDLEWTDNNEFDEDLEQNLRDETFAECYNNLNSMDIINYDNEVLPMRTLSLFRYLPKTMVETEILSQI